MTTQSLPDITTLLESVQAIARNGLHYCENAYDRERYQNLLALCTQAYSPLIDLPAATIRTRFQAEIGNITPKVGADAAIFNQAGEILLMDRADGSGWCLPCGWVEPNEKPSTAAIREVYEETGLTVAIDRLVGVFTRPAGHRHGPHAMVAVVHICNIIDGDLTLSHEGLALRYWPIADVPVWHGIHHQFATAAHDMWRTGSDKAISD